MKALLISLALVTVCWLATLCVLSARNKEYDKLADKLWETRNLNKTLGESIAQLVEEKAGVEASLKMYKTAYEKSEEVRIKLANRNAELERMNANG